MRVSSDFAVYSRLLYNKPSASVGLFLLRALGFPVPPPPLYCTGDGSFVIVFPQQGLQGQTVPIILKSPGQHQLWMPK